MAYVVRRAGSQLSEDQVIQFVAGQVCCSRILILCRKKNAAVPVTIAA